MEFEQRSIRNWAMYMYIQRLKWEALTWATRLIQAWTWVSHLRVHNSIKLSYLSGYAAAKFGWRRIGQTPRGPSKPLTIAQATLFKTWFCSVLLNRAKFPSYSSLLQMRTPHSSRWESRFTSLYVLSSYLFLSSFVSIISIVLGTL